MKSRKQLITNLAKYEGNLSVICNELSCYEWDCDEELYTINSEDIIAVLERFLNDEIKEKELSVWADSLEMREDLDYEKGKEGEIAQCLFELSTPEINGTPTKESVSKLIEYVK